MIITAAEFARLAGVSKPAVSKAPASKIYKEPDGRIDTDNPVNAVYLAEHGGKIATRVAPKATQSPAIKTQSKRNPDPEDAAFQTAVRKRQAKKLAEPARGGELDLSPNEREALRQSIADIMGETANLDISKKKADIALKIAMEKRHSFKLAQDKKLVVPREDVRRAFAMMSASIESNVLKSPAHAVPTLFAMAKAGASIQDGILELERILGQSVARVVEETAVAI